MKPSVLLVEDDPAVVRFVEMAVDDIGIELRTCTTVAEALAALRARPAQLIVTDLMLPGASGQGLLQRLRHGPEAALLEDATLVVYSAGITSALEAELNLLGVWRQLHKPVSVTMLRSCIHEALSLAAGAVPGASVSVAMAAVDDRAGSDNHAEAAAVARYFAGNLPLFRAYRQACLLQFPVDLACGRAAFGQRDLASLHRLAHSLKSVFLSLGLPDASADAKSLELAALRDDWDGVMAAWPGFHEALVALCTAPPSEG